MTLIWVSSCATTFFTRSIALCGPRGVQVIRISSPYIAPLFPLFLLTLQRTAVLGRCKNFRTALEKRSGICPTIH